jgi:hypothetical protein
MEFVRSSDHHALDFLKIKHLLEGRKGVVNFEFAGDAASSFYRWIGDGY